MSFGNLPLLKALKFSPSSNVSMTNGFSPIGPVKLPLFQSKSNPPFTLCSTPTYARSLQHRAKPKKPVVELRAKGNLEGWPEPDCWAPVLEILALPPQRCVCVRVRVQVCVCVFTYVYIYMYEHMYTYMHITYTYTPIYIYAYMIPPRVCLILRAWFYPCVCAHAYVCVCVWPLFSSFFRSCVCVVTCNECMRTYAFINLHTSLDTNTYTCSYMYIYLHTIFLSNTPKLSSSPTHKYTHTRPVAHRRRESAISPTKEPYTSCKRALYVPYKKLISH